MQALRSRSLGAAELGGIVLAGAIAPLLVVAVAGGGGPLGWVALACGAACASGLALGSAMRPLPALALALLAAAALALATAASGEPGTEQRPFPSARTTEPATPPPPAAGEPARTGEAVRPRRTAARFVRGYYAAIEAGRFENAWSRLSAAAQARSQSFDAWRGGYATTVSHRVERLETAPGGVVDVVFAAVDRTPCGTTTERRFAVRWRVAPTAGGFTATALSGVKLSGVDPHLAC